ncbi:PucR family transcriptional regulator [Mycolicibacterium mengxianglii]|uniref:PucR family transcriptional regulator n=1 Tax=Mycolicibacterium mengxianglii TaxID=2736649 RepID=UPI0018D0FD4D|nr:helix-turn-helix domain-containing protein [Mycolicibacterium mengxianglii]
MVTLDRLVNVLGGTGVRLRFCAVPRSSELRSVALPETVGDRGVVTGDVLLATGASSVEEAVAWAVAAKAVVVLFRGETDGPVALDDAPVAVMTVDPDVAWSELAAVVYGLVLEGRETESGRGPTDLFALADSVADAVGAAVTIEDRLSQVLAYSRLQQDADDARVQTILRREPPQELRALLEQRGVFTHLAKSDAPLFVPGDPSRNFSGRMVVAARAGRQLLGSVWVSTPAPLQGRRLTALVDGGQTVAVHLLRSRASADLERQVESELVLRLLEGAADAATVASRLGLAPDLLRVIAVRGYLDDDRDAVLLQLFEQATAGFGWSRPGRSALAGNTVYTVLPAGDVATARRWISALRAALPEQATVSAGISSAVTAAEAAIARAEADECLALHEVRSSTGPAPAYEEAWHDVLLQRLRTAARAGRVPDRGPVAELRRHDREHSTQYVVTLRAWLEAMGDLAQAGAALGVHENTIRYRLRKMTEVAALDLKDPGTRVALIVELAAADPT